MASSGTGSGEPGSVRVRGCPHCKKSLPRCALCMVALDAAMPTGMPSRKPAANGAAQDLDNGAASLEGLSSFDASVLHGVGVGVDALSGTAFGGWFSWCQHCRHGGHAEHLRDWFRHHEQCPVHDCPCYCRNRDG